MLATNEANLLLKLINSKYFCIMFYGFDINSKCLCCLSRDQLCLLNTIYVFFQINKIKSYFQYACQNNRPLTISVLLSHGANPQIRASEKGWVPLHFAACLGYVEAVQVSFSLPPPSSVYLSKFFYIGSS